MTWTALRVIPTSDRDAVATALFAAGSQGVLEDGPAFVTHFPPGTDLARVRAVIAAADAEAHVTTSDAAPIDWTERWKDRLTAYELGALTVVPPWLAEGRDPAHTIVIDPGMAFGTGDHPTTRGVIRLMQPLIRHGDLVADLGAGSAVLSIAAAKLGAARVAAIELEHDSIENAESNVRANGVERIVTVIEGDAGVLLQLVAPVRVIVANIISSVLLSLLPAMRAALAPGGHVVLSGMLCEERAGMLTQLALHGWLVDAEDTEELWWSVAIRTA